MKLRRALAGFWKFMVGVVFCQTLAGSLIVLGWTCRLMQRAALKHWWKQSQTGGVEADFNAFLAASQRTRPHENWPNWIVGQGAWKAIRAAAAGGSLHQLGAVFLMAGHSLWLNVKTGAQAIFNTWVLTLPAGVLWLFAWYDGWNNSFNKGYEQAVVGPLTGVVGVILFIAAMFYVPMAQARQAVTGDWRRFYDFRLVWALARRQWLPCFFLAILYSALWFPVNILKTIPAFLPVMNASLGEMDAAQARDYLKTYFLWSGVFFFPAFVLLRMLAARIYAEGVLSAVRAGSLAEDQLGEFEWEALHRLDLLQVRPAPVRAHWVRAAAWFASRTGRATAATLLVFIWFTFVAQIFIAEFFIYHPKIGWLNQPLVQLPWFRYLPPASGE